MWHWDHRHQNPHAKMLSHTDLRASATSPWLVSLHVMADAPQLFLHTPFSSGVHPFSQPVLFLQKWFPPGIWLLRRRDIPYLPPRFSMGS